MLAILVIMFISTIIDVSYVLKELLSNFHFVKSIVRDYSQAQTNGHDNTRTAPGLEDAGLGAVVPFSINVD